MPPARIKINALKEFASQRLPRNAPLREVLLSEEDELEVDVFLARLPIWLKLSNFLKGDN